MRNRGFFYGLGCPLQGAAILFAFGYRLTRKRVFERFATHLVTGDVLLELVPYVFLNRLFVTSHRIDVVPRHQKCRFPYLYLRFACRSKIIRLLLPLRYPTNSETLYFGGIAT